LICSRFETKQLAQLLSVFPEGYEIVAIKNDRAAKLDSVRYLFYLKKKN
jgi:hypothetical protein